MGSREKIEKLRNENKSYNEISKILGISKATVSYHAIRLNLNNPINGKKIKTDVDTINKIIELSKTNQKKYVAKILNVSYTTVKRYTEKNPKKTKEEITKKALNSHQDWRIKIKKQCVDYLGGKCQFCGYNKCIAALDFHHQNMSEKDYNISGRNLKCFEKLKPELDKCILLCSNCHREIHNKHLINVP